MASHMDLTPTQKLKRASIFLGGIALLMGLSALYGVTHPQSTSTTYQQIPDRQQEIKQEDAVVIQPAKPVKYVEIQYKDQMASLSYDTAADYRDAERKMGEKADKSITEQKEGDAYMAERNALIDEFLAHKECNVADRARIQERYNKWRVR